MKKPKNVFFTNSNWKKGITIHHDNDKSKENFKKKSLISTTYTLKSSDLALKRPNQDWHKAETVFGFGTKTNQCVLQLLPNYFVLAIVQQKHHWFGLKNNSRNPRARLYAECNDAALITFSLPWAVLNTVYLIWFSFPHLSWFL